MSALAQPVRGRALLLASFAALAAFLLLVALGTWQLERKAWKEALLAQLDQRLSAAPAALPPRPHWDGLDRDEYEFRRVAFAAEFLRGKDALVYSAGSTLRGGGPGYLVFTPARLSDGGLVMVDRGFVPEGKQAAAADVPGGSIEIVGAMRWPEARSYFTPNDEPARNLWFARDPDAIAAAKGIAVAPFYIEQEAPAAPSGLPQVGRLQPNLLNNHLQYALTWYGLALALAGVYGVWLFARMRESTVSADRA